MFIIDQYAGEDYQEAFALEAAQVMFSYGGMYFSDFRDAGLAYCNL